MQVVFGTFRDISTALFLLPPQETQLIDTMNSLDQSFLIFDEYQNHLGSLPKIQLPKQQSSFI